MLIRIFFVLAISFWLLAPPFVSPGKGAEGDEKYTPEACAKIPEELSKIRGEIADWENKKTAVLFSDNYSEKKRDSKLEAVQVKRRRIGCLFPSRLDKEDAQKCFQLTRDSKKIWADWLQSYRQVTNLSKEIESLEKKRDALTRSVDDCKKARQREERARQREERARQREKEKGWKPASVGIVPCNELPGWTVDSDVKCAKSTTSVSTSPAPAASTASAPQTPTTKGTGTTQPPATSSRPPGCTLYKWKKCRCRC